MAGGLARDILAQSSHPKSIGAGIPTAPSTVEVGRLVFVTLASYYAHWRAARNCGFHRVSIAVMHVGSKMRGCGLMRGKSERLNDGARFTHLWGWLR